jgi:flagellar basal-body rod protein FlgC
MSLFTVFTIAASALAAQSQRLNVVASNLANADSATTASGTPYKAREVVFTATPVGPGETGMGVNVTGVVENPAPPRLVYDPTHPMADANGYVTMPNVSVVEEMTNMISASRSYQTNLDLINTTKSLLLRTIALAQ